MSEEPSLPRSTLVALAVLIAAATAVGCVQSDGTLEDDSETSTIGLPEARELAGPHAEDWNEDAELAMAVALEAADPDALKNASSEEQAAGPTGPKPPEALLEALETPDPNVGDGRAWAWSLVYLVEETGTYQHILVSGADRSVEEAALPDRDQLATQPLGSWDVNASAAVDALPAGKDGETVPDTEEGAIALILGSPEDPLPDDRLADDPLWTVLIPGRGQHEGGLAFVNAKTGQPVTLAELLGSALEQEQRKEAGVSPDEEIPEPPTRTVTFNGTLQDGGETQAHGFSIEPGQGKAEIRYRWSEPEIQDNVTLQVETPNGTETHRILTFGSGPGVPSMRHTLEDPQPGEFASRLNFTADHNVSGEIRYEAEIEIYEGPSADPAVQREVSRWENGTVAVEGTLRPSYPSTWPEPTTNLTEEVDEVRLKFLWDGGAISSARYTLESGLSWLDHDERFEHRIEGELRGVEWHYEDLEPGTYTARKTGHGTVAGDVPLAYKLELVVH